MIKGFYSAGSGMLVGTKKIDVISNNIANSKTSGFKEDMLLAMSYNSIQAVDRVSTVYEQGVIQTTNDPYNLAIAGNGFFTVQDAANATLYTRNGNFAIDAEGYIATLNGNRLMGQNGAINTGGQPFAVDLNGDVYVNNMLIDRLAIYNPVNTDTLISNQDGTFFQSDNAVLQNEFTGTINQGCLEDSKIDMIQQMMNLMDCQNSIRSCSQALKMIDSTLEHSVTLAKKAY